MAITTKIEWTDATWSPIRVRVKQDASEIARAKGYTSLVTIAEKMAGHVGAHCEHVSPGCEHCYAETNNHRCLPANGTGLPYDRRSRDLVEAFIDEKVLLAPLGWKKPRKIFVENQSDLFAEWVTDAMRDSVFAVMRLFAQHTFQVLTKRPAEMLRYISSFQPRPIEGSWGWSDVDLWPLPNVWQGVTAENQPSADERIPLLLETPAAVRYVSCEPLLGDINLGQIPNSRGLAEGQPYLDVLKAYAWAVHGPDYYDVCNIDSRIDWVICGGESGPGARPMERAWAQSLRDQCIAAQVPFFFKQWGEWMALFSADEADNWDPRLVMTANHSHVRVGKKRAPRDLDGREWKQFPEVHR